MLFRNFSFLPMLPNIQKILFFQTFWKILSLASDTMVLAVSVGLNQNKVEENHEPWNDYWKRLWVFCKLFQKKKIFWRTVLVTFVLGCKELSTRERSKHTGVQDTVTFVPISRIQMHWFISYAHLDVVYNLTILQSEDFLEVTDRT